MMDSLPRDLFWDSCVVTRFLTGEPDVGLAAVRTLVDEAIAGKRRIWISTILYAEVRPSQLAKAGFGSITDLIDDLEGAMLPVGPNPNIMLQASRLRDHAYLAEKPQRDEKTRVLTVGDAIQFATCLHIRDQRGCPDIRFHTFDDGKTKNYEEKAVSLLRFEQYATRLMDNPDVAAVCELPRARPDSDVSRLL